MICEAVNVHNNGFANNNSLGCNISVTLSDGSFGTQIIGDVSPKRPSFFENLIRKSPSGKKEKSQSSWTNIFAKKATTPKSEGAKEQSREDEEMAKFIEQLQLDGKSEDEIKMHLSYINDVRTSPATNSPATTSPAPAKNKNIVSQFFSEVQQAFKEISFADDDYPQYVEESDLRGLTISISTAPFYGALPPDSDMTYEELASFEPVYIGSRCINNLPSCVHDGTPLPGDQAKCSVCLCEFEEGETLKSLPCVHFFHQDCIDSWLMVGHTCPLCKTLVQ